VEPIFTVPVLEINAPSVFSTEGSGYVNELPPHPDIAIRRIVKTGKTIIG
jgi:hypothetical protein